MGAESTQAEIRKEKSEPSGLSVGISKSKSCELCQVEIAVVYCRVDIVFLRLSCDARLHNANKSVSKHWCRWLCKVCGQGHYSHPTMSGSSRGVSRALCITDDYDDDDVHPLMRRHKRILVKSVPSPNDQSSNGHVIAPPPAN